MKEQFEMVAKTFQGLEDVLAEELKNIGASNIEIGRRMVSFEGDLEILYKANLCCRTALRILKPIYKFIAEDPDSLYEMVKEYDWTKILGLDKTFSIDSVVNSDDFAHSRFVTYRVKDAIADFFKDKYGPDKRPGVRLQNADIIINVHISENRVTLSLDSSGESLHKRGYRVAQTEAPINEVLAAGIILKSGWNGNTPFIDPMCGSGTFLVEAALIAANINPGIYRQNFAFENWKDFDQELFDSIYSDDSKEREIKQPIIGCDISPKAISIAEKNLKSAGVAKYVDLSVKSIYTWNNAPENGYIVTNPPYGERISAENMDELYQTIGSKLKHIFKGYHAWIIGYKEDYFKKIGLTPSVKIPLYNGALECELREYVIFEGDYNTFRKEGGSIKNDKLKKSDKKPAPRRLSDREWTRDARKKGMGGKDGSDKTKRTFDKDKTKFQPKATPIKKELPEKKKEVSENPLAARRNEHALKMIIGRKPSLPPTESEISQARRGWKRKQENKDNND